MKYNLNGKNINIPDDDIEILNVGKLISFRIGEEKYEIDLKQKRKPKETAKK